MRINQRHRTFVCLQQRSQRRHRSAIVNSAVKRDPGLIRAQEGGNQREEQRQRDKKKKES